VTNLAIPVAGSHRRMQHTTVVYTSVNFGVFVLLTMRPLPIYTRDHHTEDLTIDPLPIYTRETVYTRKCTRASVYAKEVWQICQCTSAPIPDIGTSSTATSQLLVHGRGSPKCTEQAPMTATMRPLTYVTRPGEPTRRPRSTAVLQTRSASPVTCIRPPCLMLFQ
jgi:hypothetical protein